MAIYLAVKLKPIPTFSLAASLFVVATLLLLWETFAILRQSRISSMPIALSWQRPLGLVSVTIFMLAILLLSGLFVGITAE
jgi:hypothetical protein